MKITHLLAVASLLAAGTAAAHDNGRANVLFKFDGGVGVQPLRTAPGGVPVLNTVGGVNPGGAPWGITSFQATIKTTGEIRGKGTGVLLYGADGLGTRAGPRQVIISLFCRNAPVAPQPTGLLILTSFNSAPVDLNADGDFEVRGSLTDATGATPPLNCGDNVDNRPVLLIRSVIAANPTTGTPATPGVWFAAGLLKSADNDDGHGGRGDY